MILWHKANLYFQLSQKSIELNFLQISYQKIEEVWVLLQLNYLKSMKIDKCFN